MHASGLIQTTQCMIVYCAAVLTHLSSSPISLAKKLILAEKHKQDDEDTGSRASSEDEVGAPECRSSCGFV